MKQKIKFKQTEIGMIPEDWEVGIFDNDLIVKGRIGWRGYKTSDLRESGPIVLGGENIKSFFYIDYSNVKHLSKEKYEESPEIQLKPNDVLLVTRGNLGEVAHFKGEFEEVTINPSIVILSNFNGDSKFLYYFLISPQGKGTLNSIKSGSSVPAIYQSEVKRIKYPKPIIEEQRAIAKILSDLDSEIELLQKQNETLEKIGQAIFKHWFVDKRIEGDFTKGQLGDIMTLEYGKGLPKEKRKSGEIPVYGSGGIYGYTENFLVEAPGIVVGRAGHPGSVYMSGKNFFPVDSTFYVNCEKAYFFYLYFMLKRLDLGRLNTGSAVPGLNRNNAYRVNIEYPDKETANKFNKLCQHLFNKIWINQDQINDLEQIKDSLLPRLMSGKIRVPVEVRG